MIWETVTPLVDEPEQSAYFPVLNVDDRVRVIYRPECPKSSWASLLIDGELGTIVEVDLTEENGHGYKIAIDRPQIFPAAWMGIFGPWCAITELEPL